MKNAALIERLQKLNGPCRETDVAILLAYGGYRDVYGDGMLYEDARGYSYSLDGDYKNPALPSPTGSVDAARSLLPWQAHPSATFTGMVISQAHADHEQVVIVSKNGGQYVSDANDLSWIALEGMAECLRRHGWTAKRPSRRKGPLK